jgi:hypothetical protein
MVLKVLPMGPVSTRCRPSSTTAIRRYSESFEIIVKHQIQM